MKMQVHVLWFISFFILIEGQDGFLGRNEGINTRRGLIVDKKKHPGPVQEYELLLQVAYRDSKEKRDMKNFLKLLKPPSLWLQKQVKIIRAKATTYCGNQNGVLQCACEDGYTWFPPSCLDPQKCYLHTAGGLQSCHCHLNNLTHSINFCERTKVWGTFKINERFAKDLLNSSSPSYSKYATGIEIQLKETFKRIQDFESVHVTQFRHSNDGSIIVGFEVVGSSSTSELLSAIEQVAEKVKAGLYKLFLLEDGSFRVFGKAQCNSIVFGFGSMNDEYILPCSSGYTGNITARCQPSGWRILRETCVHSQLEELKKNFSVITGNATETAVSSLVRNLSVVIQQNPSTTAGNLASVVSILDNVLSLSLASHFKVSSSTMEDVISIADHILNSSSVTNWTVLLQEEQHASSRLLKTLENISSLVPPTALPLNFSREFINWKGSPVSPSQLKMGYNYQTEMFPPNASIPIRGRVLIESDQFQRSLPETIISMASLTLGTILSVTKNGNAQVNGPVISTIIQNYSINEVFLIFSKIESNLSQPHCVFWDFGLLQWNNAGCHLVNETPDMVMCRCTHLTSFSVLMSPFVPSAIIPVVKWITFVGLGISIGSLTLCLIIEALFWKQVKKNQTSYTRHVCMVNIALCLLIADVWFLVAATGDSPVNLSRVCVAAVFFMHFFYLSLFFWMLTLGILLAYRILLVFHHMAMPSMIAIGFCLGYGCPLIICAITIAVTQPSNGYTRKDVCWLNWSDRSKPLLAFAVPALTIVAVNLVVVLLVLRKLWRPTVGERPGQENKATIVRMGKSLLILTPLLGLTWGFGIGTIVDNQNLAWHVVFALLNAFQGFFILCFGMLLDSKLRQLLFSKLSPLSSWKQASKQDSSDVSAKPKFPKTFNPLQHKGIYALSHAGESSNDIMLTQFLSTE
ncbi:adhesion G-protein coupled receptor F1 [Mustela nigripes]|uniref:Adhesion G protein-coupled receptor F1 n=1 Tax=Mustela putorius furo TaxID=9669 RepID=M3YLW0_MUSPF|nr:adhesion G-protein coupled receptor F1 [Mustela lutreola]XP_059034175.1 adhesion G-protein coupled receptor F1 [Mustela lutreola]XP_059034176.1 adhesion G-protein coupled receptor F1 [Mustela lutreola]XP_059256277.1 adhesion G-protein coupled receptor F1 [Mustela nigripes]XP_059256278.1 adhesion G-protein coupled receptor F1 [Mustela nigripes]XP_059256279.1 adhesion G-protein coupled receptor F1 [Mustela nigripes]